MCWPLSFLTAWIVAWRSFSVSSIRYSLGSSKASRTFRFARLTYICTLLDALQHNLKGMSSQNWKSLLELLATQDNRIFADEPSSNLALKWPTSSSLYGCPRRSHLLLQHLGCLQKEALFADGVAAKEEKGLVLIVPLSLEDINDVLQHLSSSKLTSNRGLTLCTTLLSRTGMFYLLPWTDSVLEGMENTSESAHLIPVGVHCQELHLC